MPQSTLETCSEAQMALGMAREHLLSLQDEAGWWRGELQTNVTMDAEDMLLREFLGIRRADQTERSAAWIRSQQRPDGTWANFHGGPGEPSTTIEAYWALRLAGDAPEAEHMRSAAEFIRAQGGLENARVFTHLWLALFGLWSWDRVPALPPEIILLPPSVALNVYDFACWARQTIVALSLVKAHRPARTLAFDLGELRVPNRPERPGSARPISLRGRCLIVLDRISRIYEKHPFRPLRRLAVARAERWIVRRQEADGSWGGIQPPWVYSLMALHLGGYPLDHPVMRRGLEGLERFMVEDRDDARGVGAPEGESRRLEACQSPVWDTALSIVALSDAGLPGDHPAMTRAADWLLGEVEGRQSSDGGWGAFDADNTRSLVRELPFLDFGEVIDAPSADVTGHALEMLAALGLASSPAARRGVQWLIDHQEPGGSWFGRWGVNHIYGTGAVIPGLIAAGLDGSHESIRRAVSWLESHQNEDGG